jgi:hypothetical protein
METGLLGRPGLSLFRTITLITVTRYSTGELIMVSNSKFYAEPDGLVYLGIFGLFNDVWTASVV